MCHVCNPTCYKSDIDASKKLCRYGFPQPLINKIHFDNHTKLFHIKRIDKWWNNANPWILLAYRCNHHFNLITTFGKDSKSLIYYITNYITKTSIYTTQMYYLLQIAIQKVETINNNTNSYDVIEKSLHLLIRCLNTLGSQQEISTTKAIN